MGRKEHPLAGEYAPLSLADDEEAAVVATPRSAGWRTLLISISASKWTFFANMTLFLFSALLLLLVMLQRKSIASRQNQADISWSPVTDKMKSNTVRFNETFLFPTKFVSKFAGPPSPAIDNEWEKFTKHEMLDGRRGTLAVTGEVVSRLAEQYDQPWLDSVVKVPHPDQNRYMATLEMCHHLHCLDMLRKATYFEYYTDHDPRQMHGHLDHCIESLREVLMCNSGTNIAMFHWVEGNDAPYPDYNTYHQCRDPYDVLNWALDQAVPVVSPMRKGANEFAMQGPPY